MVQTSEVRVGRDATDGLNSTLDVATGQPRGAPMKHGGRVLGALFDKAEARMLSLGFIQLYVLVIVRLARRELVWINVTAHPTAEWIAQQLTEAFPWNEVPRYLIRDLWAPLLPCREGLVVGVVSCGSRLVHTPIALNTLACMIILASFHP